MDILKLLQKSSLKAGVCRGFSFDRLQAKAVAEGSGDCGLLLGCGLRLVAVTVAVYSLESRKSTEF